MIERHTKATSFNEAPAGGRGMPGYMIERHTKATSFNEAPAGGRGMQIGFQFVHIVDSASMMPRLEAGECSLNAVGNSAAAELQ